MKLTHEGLSLWYGTPDAPAPLDEIVTSSNAVVTVGVHPANPTNTVHVRYRVDGGFVQSVPARLLRTDYDRNSQYFLAKFPALPGGGTVEFCPVMASAGRQVPAPGQVDRLPSKFVMTAPPCVAPPIRGATASDPYPVFLPELTFFAHVTVHFEEPQFIGETPDGVRINYFAKSGTFEGPRYHGKILQGSSDHLVVRPDGIAVIHVQATIAMIDGALLQVEYVGNLELGADGYRRALTNDLPQQPSFVICPRVSTGHPKYVDLNRLQFVGLGDVHLAQLKLDYDLYAVTRRPRPTGG